ncbi:MAG: UDP-N-acetylmuramoyl-L-alanine--D-glutamate ligase [Anaerolineae bacterium]|nr:UDP-N-acetylmuramoyl-L-alanine--D-glutamate ligase [Anaerolineae bacterium]
MVTEVAGKRVVVVGLGRQGRAAAQWLAAVGAHVTVTDQRDAGALAQPMAALELAGAPVEYALGGHPLGLLDRADLVCISGGVPLDSPFVVEARARSIPVTNDAQLFIERCPARTIGITGSAGKTTTTSLVGAMCYTTGRQTWVGGNIGHVLLDELANIGPDDWVVMELSSFQLDVMTVSPNVAAVLNVTPNHLDRHGSMAAYIAAKAHILMHQRVGDAAVLGCDDPGAKSMAAYAQSAIWWFGICATTRLGAYLDGDDLMLALPGAGAVVVCSRGDIQLRGEHNLLNVLAACAIGGAAGVPVEAMRATIPKFTAVPHRLESVATVDGALWVNDSIATAPERVIAALRSYDAPIILLAGGRDKNLPWQAFAREVVERVRRLICFGEAGPMILRHVSFAAMQQSGQLEAFDVVADLENAVARAADLAQPGEVVLLSPGGTSFDAYRDFEERGAHFRELVGRLAAGGAEVQGSDGEDGDEDKDKDEDEDEDEDKGEDEETPVER